MSPVRNVEKSEAATLSAIVLGALASGRKLDAVKALRAETGLSLTDALERIDAHIAATPALATRFARQHDAMRGKLRRALLIAAALVAVAAWIVLG